MVGEKPNVLKRLIYFLAQPQLVIHEPPTPDDLEAEKIMRSILEMYGSQDELQIIKWGNQEVDWVMPDRLPAVRTVGSIFHGLSAIRHVAAVERKDWEGAQAYG